MLAIKAKGDNYLNTNTYFLLFNYSIKYFSISLINPFTASLLRSHYLSHQNHSNTCTSMRFVAKKGQILVIYIYIYYNLNLLHFKYRWWLLGFTGILTAYLGSTLPIFLFYASHLKNRKIKEKKRKENK